MSTRVYSNSVLEEVDRKVLRAAEPGMIIDHSENRLFLTYRTRAAAEAAKKLLEGLQLDCHMEEVSASEYTLSVIKCGDLLEELEEYCRNRPESREFFEDSLRARFANSKFRETMSGVGVVTLSDSSNVQALAARVYIECPSNYEARVLDELLEGAIKSGLIRQSPREKEAMQKSPFYVPVARAGNTVIIHGLDPQPGVSGGLLAEMERLGCPGAKVMREKLMASTVSAALKEHVGVSFGQDAIVKAAAADPKLPATRAIEGDKDKGV